MNPLLLSHLMKHELLKLAILEAEYIELKAQIFPTQLRLKRITCARAKLLRKAWDRERNSRPEIKNLRHLRYERSRING